MRKLDPIMLTYISERLKGNALADHAIKTKNPRLLLVEAAKVCVGIREKTGKNDGVLVEAIQRVAGGSRGSAWCFPGSHEIMTTKGWVRFDELDEECVVAQVNEVGEISFTKPIAFIKKQYDGVGYRLKTRSLDIVCDAGHRFWGAFNNSESKKFGTLDEVTTNLRVEFGASVSKGIGLSNQDLLLLAAFVSDGFYKRNSDGTPSKIHISVSKSRKVDILLSSGLASSLYEDKKIRGISKQPMKTFKFNIPNWFDAAFIDYKVFNFNWLASMSALEAQTFLRYYNLFDGSGHSTKTHLYSSSHEIVDALVFISILAGYSPSVALNGRSKFSGEDNYAVRFRPEPGVKFITKNHIEEVSLSQDLYCVQVPDERIIVRGNSKTPLVVGNCMFFSQTCIAYVEHTLGVKSPLHASGHCLTVWNKTPASQRVKIHPLPGAIPIWRHGKTTNGHTEVLLAADNKTMHCVGGNTSGADGTGKVTREGNGVFYTERSMQGFPNVKTQSGMILVGFLKPF
jgi:hypothetical protein